MKSSDFQSLSLIDTVIAETRASSKESPQRISQIEKIYSAIDSAFYSDNSAIILKSFKLVRMWLSGKVVLGVNDTERNEFLRKLLQVLLTELVSEGRIKLSDVSEMLSDLIYSPPFKFEEQTWCTLAKMLPKFSDCGSGKGKQKIQELEMNVFFCSGLYEEKMMEMLKKHKTDKYWEDLIGVLLSLIIFGDKVKGNKLLVSGVWSKENPVPKAFAEMLLKVMLNREVNEELKSHCLFGIVRTLKLIDVGMFKFLIPIDVILESFGDSIFPFDHLLPECYKEIYDIFRYGMSEKNSKWEKIFANSICQVLCKNRPASTT